MDTINQIYALQAGTETKKQTERTTASSTSSNFKSALSAAVKAPQSMDAMFAEASRKYGVSENLLKAVAKAESNFNPKATSPKGAAGVMQLMPATARYLGVSDPYDARSNIMGGAKYLKENLDRYDGNVDLALAAYNAGGNNVKKYGGIPPFKETQEYVKKIRGYMGQTLTAGNVRTGYASSQGRPKGTSSYPSVSAFGTSNGYFPSIDEEDLLSQYSADDGYITIRKSDYLYLMELMKFQMQMKTYDVSNLTNMGDFTSYV